MSSPRENVHARAMSTVRARRSGASRKRRAIAGAERRYALSIGTKKIAGAVERRFLADALEHVGHVFSGTIVKERTIGGNQRQAASRRCAFSEMLAHPVVGGEPPARGDERHDHP